jgi:hypothetical protein
MNKQQLIQKLESFTADFPNVQLPISDVIKLVSELEDRKVELGEFRNELGELSNLLVEKISNLITDAANDHELVDYDSAEISISYNNKVVLDSVSLDLEPVIGDVEKLILAEFDAMYIDLIEDIKG